MSRYADSSSPRVQRQRAREGRGQGEGQRYKPGITVRDLASLGLSSRVHGWKTNRVHHLLSLLELAFFYVLEWSTCVTDIQEQYPLSLVETLAIAEQSGIPHPTNDRTGDPYPLSTDFLVTIRTSSGLQKKVAHSCKYASDLQGRARDGQANPQRILELAEIERRLWQEGHEVPWGFILDTDIPEAVFTNVDWLHRPRDIDAIAHVDSRACRHITALLDEAIAAGPVSLAPHSLEVDERLGQRPGTSLLVARHLLANGRYSFDITRPIDPDEPFPFARSVASIIVPATQVA